MYLPDSASLCTMHELSGIAEIVDFPLHVPEAVNVV